MSTVSNVHQLKTLLEMLAELKKADRAGEGFHIRIENLPYMALVIEDVQEPGPDGHRVISVTHYGEQNGDAMRDPEMLFQLIKSEDTMQLSAFYYRNDYVGVEEWSRWREQGSLVVRQPLQRDHQRFAYLWDRNLRDQGFPEALRTMLFRDSNQLFTTQ